MKFDEFNFWDRRDNLDNRPSMQYRSIRIVQHIMQKHNVKIGEALEMLMMGSPIYTEALEELKDDYPDIAPKSA